MARIFTFGKYKWIKVDDMIDSNPEYVIWAEKHVPYFNLTATEKIKLKQICLMKDISYEATN